MVQPCQHWDSLGGDVGLGHGQANAAGQRGRRQRLGGCCHFSLDPRATSKGRIGSGYGLQDMPLSRSECWEVIPPCTNAFDHGKDIRFWPISRSEGRVELCRESYVRFWSKTRGSRWSRPLDVSEAYLWPVVLAKICARSHPRSGVSPRFIHGSPRSRLQAAKTWSRCSWQARRR